MIHFKKKKKVECNEVHNTVMKNKNMYTQCSQLYSESIHKIIEHKDKLLRQSGDSWNISKRMFCFVKSYTMKRSCLDNEEWWSQGPHMVEQRCRHEKIFNKSYRIPTTKMWPIFIWSNKDSSCTYMRLTP